MKLSIHAIWSSTLSSPEGAPADLEDFAVDVELSLVDQDHPLEPQLFRFRVCSPSRVAEDGRFVTHTLVLHQFSWDAIRARVEKLLRHTESCATWVDAIDALSPYLSYAE